LLEGDCLVRDCISEHMRENAGVRTALARLSTQGKEKVREVEGIALDAGSDNDLRLEAIALVLAMKQDSTQFLARLLDADDKFIIVETLKRIREFATDWAVPELISRVKKTSDSSVRAIFAWALAGYPNNAEVRDALLELIKRDSDAAVRDHALESLGAFRSPVVVDALLGVLDHGSANERFWSLYSLGTLGDDRAVDAISRCLEDHTKIPDFGTISAEAKWALESIAKRTRDFI